MQQLDIQSRKTISDKLLEKLKRLGKKPKLKVDRQTLFFGNFEVSEIVSEVLICSSMSGYYNINYSTFKYLSKIYEHQEIKRNIQKLRSLKEALNDRRKAEDDKKSKK